MRPVFFALLATALGHSSIASAGNLHVSDRELLSAVNALADGRDVAVVVSGDDVASAADRFRAQQTEVFTDGTATPSEHACVVTVLGQFDGWTLSPNDGCTGTYTAAVEPQNTSLADTPAPRQLLVPDDGLADSIAAYAREAQVTVVLDGGGVSSAVAELSPLGWRLIDGRRSARPSETGCMVDATHHGTAWMLTFGNGCHGRYDGPLADPYAALAQTGAVVEAVEEERAVQASFRPVIVQERDLRRITAGSRHKWVLSGDAVLSTFRGRRMRAMDIAVALGDQDLYDVLSRTRTSAPGAALLVTGPMTMVAGGTIAGVGVGLLFAGITTLNPGAFLAGAMMVTPGGVVFLVGTALTLVGAALFAVHKRKSLNLRHWFTAEQLTEAVERNNARLAQ